MQLIQGNKYSNKMLLKKITEGDYFEFSLCYTDNESIRGEFERFREQSRKKTRFKNRYEGPVAVDLSEWNDTQNIYLEKFLYCLFDYSRNSLVVLTIEKECSQELLCYIKNVFEEVKILKSGECKTLNYPYKGKMKQVGFVMKEKECDELFTKQNIASI